MHQCRSETEEVQYMTRIPSWYMYTMQLRVRERFDIIHFWRSIVGYKNKRSGYWSGRKQGNGLGYIRARAGARCARASGNYS